MIQFSTLDKNMQIAPVEAGFCQLCGRNDTTGGRLYRLFNFIYVVHAITSPDSDPDNDTSYYRKMVCKCQNKLDRVYGPIIALYQAKYAYKCSFLN